MKTLFPIIAVVLFPLAPIHGAPPFPPASPGPGQPYYDYNADADLQQLHTDNTNFKTDFDTAIAAANASLAQIQKDSDNTSKDMDAMTAALQGLQRVVGDPSLITSGKGAPTASSVQALETDFSNFNTKSSSKGITFSTDPLKHFDPDSNGVPNQEDEMTGSNQQNTLTNLVYNGTAAGLYTAIGSSYTTMKSPDPNNAGQFIDPTSANRGSVPSSLVPNSGTNKGVSSDGVTYLPEASELVAVNDYFNVRDAALTRREALQKALTDAVNALDTAPDFATSIKISTLIVALQAQMQACDNDVTIAFNDLAARGMQVYTMNSVAGKASGEAGTALMLASQNAANALSGPGVTPPTSNSGSPTAISGYSPAQTPAPSGATAASGYSTNFFPWTVYQ